jgi:haloacetate dehalogenase
MGGMFDGFTDFDIHTGGTTIRGRHAGYGPAVLLLHGIPQTHLMWHRVAPALAREFTVVVTDLRGYGGSGTPPSSADHAPYSMRELARDQVEVMRALGHDRFAVVGHDRGARCAYRMALDHPGVVDRLAVLDVVPTADVFRRADKNFSEAFWLWSFLAAPEPVPERLIAGAPATLVDHMLDTWAARPDVFEPAARRQYHAQFRSPDHVHAICEQYRAAATLDVAHDEQDRGRRRIECAVLALWSAGGPLGQWYEPLTIWREWAAEVSGAGIDSGHFLPEEAPDRVVAELRTFLL